MLQHKVDIQGHRGARGLRPENTLAGFQLALELGVPTLEMDLVISADHQIVVSHDPFLSAEICSKPDGSPVLPDEEQTYNIYRMVYAEVARFDCGRRGHPRFPEQVAMPAVKPLLADVIRLAEAFAGASDVRYNLEIKSLPWHDGVFHPPVDVFAGLVYDAIYILGVLERCTIQSFDPRALLWMRGRDPAVRLSLLVENDLGLHHNLERLTFVPEVYSPEFRLVDETLVEAIHTAGMKLLPWTVNEVDEIARLVELGVDGLITDYPDRALQCLAT